MKHNTTYYLLWNRVLGMSNEDGNFLYEDGKWKPDRNVITDTLMGFDPSEPEDSPYRIGSTSITDEIEEISEEQAMKILNNNKQ